MEGKLHEYLWRFKISIRLKMAKKQIEVMGHKIEIDKNDYISLTDIARKKNITDPKYVVRNWLRNRMTLEFLGLWESINNPNWFLSEIPAKSGRIISKHYLKAL